MKKLNFLLLGLAGLVMASCSNDDLQAPAEGTYQLTVNLPKDIATRAIGDQITADQTLSYTVFTYGEAGAYVTNGTQAFGPGQTSTTVNLPLVKGNGYKIAFFSQSTSSANVYKYAPQTAEVTVDYKAMTYQSTNEGENIDADAYDCFSGTYEIKEVTGAINATVTLTRPVAQINWGTNDLTSAAVEQAFGKGTPNLKTTLTAATVPSTLNIHTGAYGTAGEVTFPATGLPSTSEAFPVPDYKYLAMQYVLAPANTTSDLKLTVTGQEAENAPDIVISVNSAPLQANFRTNIYGGLLTDQANFNVALSNTWGGEYNDAIGVSTPEEFSNALNDGKSVVLTDDITIPSTITFSKDADIHLNDHTLNLGSPYAYNVTNGSEITFIGGNLNFTGKSGASMDMMVKEGAKLSFDGVNITTTAGGLNAQQDHAGLIISNCTFTGPYYSISTNASGTTDESGGDYGKGGEITLISSTFTSTQSTPFMNNVPETVTATDCIFNGKIQAAFIRGGNATFDGCTFNLTRTMTTNPYRLATWSQGNMACLAGIVGGNYITNTNETNPSYNYPTNITLTGKTVINIEGNYANTTPGIHLCSAYKNVVTFNYDANDLTINYPTGVSLDNGYYPIEFGTLQITVNGSEITTSTNGYIGNN